VRPSISSVELDRRWVELVAVFEEVTDEEADHAWLNRLVFDRHAFRYRSVIEWARWILATLTPSLRGGGSTAPGLLFDLNLLFQSAVAALLRRRIGVPGLEVSSQESSRHLARVAGGDERRVFRLRPDLVVRRHGAVSAIGDTKWKRIEVGPSGHLMPAQADVYQMHAYASAFHCESLALIYPWHEGLRGARETAFELPAIGTVRPVLSVLCLDVHSDALLLRRGSTAAEFGALFQPTVGAQLRSVPA
jgi:5-methylcytosine-specific restriction enzyme subunit McrC